MTMARLKLFQPKICLEFGDLNVTELGLGVISRLENRTLATFNNSRKIEKGTREITNLFMCGTEALNFGVNLFFISLIFWSSSL